MKKLVTRLFKEEDGATAVEYGIMVALIAAVIVFTVQSVGTKVDGAFGIVDGVMPGGAGP